MRRDAACYHAVNERVLSQTEAASDALQNAPHGKDDRESAALDLVDPVLVGVATEPAVEEGDGDEEEARAEDVDDADLEGDAVEGEVRSEEVHQEEGHLHQDVEEHKDPEEARRARLRFERG